MEFLVALLGAVGVLVSLQLHRVLRIQSVFFVGFSALAAVGSRGESRGWASVLESIVEGICKGVALI